VEFLTQRLPSSLAVATVSMIDPVYGWDGYPAVHGRTDEDVSDLAREIEPLLTPAPFEARLKAIAMLRMRTTRRADDAGDAQLLLEAMADAMAEFPADVLGEACRSWSRLEKWFPTEAELRALCVRLMRTRKSLYDSLKGAAR